jgi:Domain of unknown function (DUF4082)/PKD domain
MAHAWSGLDPTQSGDGGSYSLGATATANVPVTVSGVRVFAGATPGVRANRKGRLWTSTESQLAIATMPDSLTPGWTEHAFTAPVDLLAGQTVTVAYDTGGFYGELLAAFDAPVTSVDGAVTFLAGASAPHGNGSFTTSVGSYPDQASGSHVFYGVDLVYTPTGGDTPPVIESVRTAQDGPDVAVTISATDAEGGSLGYGVDWGDGTSDSGSSPVLGHTYDASGMLALLVRVTDSAGLIATVAVPLFVSLPTSGLDWQQLADWCTLQLVGTDLAPEFVVGPETKKHQMPDTLGFVTPTPGAGNQTEGVVQFPTFQVRIRTLAEYVPQALAQAQILDRALLFGDWSGPGGSIWGTQILSVDRTGGGPIPLMEDDAHDRVSVVCTYFAQEAIQIIGSTP